MSELLHQQAFTATNARLLLVALVWALASCKGGGVPGPSEPARPAPTILANTSGQLMDLATDGTWVSWCEHADDGAPPDRQQVRAVRVQGGEAVTLSSHEGCEHVALSDGEVYWSDDRGGIWKRAPASRETHPIAVVGDKSRSDIADFVMSAGDLFILRDDRLEVLAARVKIPARLWSVPKGSAGGDIATGPTAVWATIGDDPMQLSDGAVGLLRVDRASRTVNFMPVHARMMVGLHVAGGRPTWTMNGATWQAPEAGGPPEQIHPFVVAATDEQGFYRNTRGSDDDFVVSYQRRGERTPIFIRGAAWHILPIAGGFIAGFPRIGVSAGLVLDPQTRRFRSGPGLDTDKVAIGYVRW